MRSTLVLLVLLTAASAWAQPVPAPATLEGWERSARVSLRDRLHAHGGLFFDRGLFRQLTPGMDHEYELDLATIGWTPREDARWLAAPVGFRMQAGSISRGRFAHRVDVRVGAELGAGTRVWLDAVQEEDVQAARLFSEVGASLRRGGHEVGLAQTFGHYKPDLDLTLFYARHASVGRLILRAEVLDVANDFIFETLGTDASLEQLVRSYERVPLGMSFAYATSVQAPTRFELFGGVQPTATARVEAAGEPAFGFADGVAYGAALVERRVGAGYRVGMTARVQHSRIRRTEASGQGYRSAQHLAEAGVTVAAAWPRLVVDAEGSLGLYSDVQRDSDFSSSTVNGAFAYRERRLMARVRADVPLRSWLSVSAVYLAQGRTSADPLPYQGFLPFTPWSPNGRLSGALLLSHARAQFALGGSLDLGGDPFYGNRPPTRYDGGYVRLSVTP
jgi:hypothetical protein